MPALLGQPGARGRENLIQQDNGRNGWKGPLVTAQVSGNSSAKVNRPRQRKGEKGKSAAPAEAKITHRLFDLESDPGESRDLAEQNPEIVERLRIELQHFLDDGRSRPSEK